MIYSSPLELIGNTPLLKLTRLVPKLEVNVYVKLEIFNLTGSVKDRPALSMIEDAEAKRLIKPGLTTLIESTSGNLGISLAAICKYKGYKFICVLDPKAEPSKIYNMKAYGAEIVMVNKPDKEGGYQKPRIAKVKELLQKIPNSFNLNQYSNPANPYAHIQTTGPEIYKDLKGKVDILVGAISTGGTLCGTAKFLKEKVQNILVTGVEPNGSIIFGGKYKPYLQQGTGLSFTPKNYNPQVINERIKVSDKQAFLTARKLALNEGILVGGSAGGVLFVTLQKAKLLKENQNIVAILPDNGNRYLETVYSDKWLNDNGIII